MLVATFHTPDKLSRLQIRKNGCAWMQYKYKGKQHNSIYIKTPLSFLIHILHVIYDKT